MKFICFGSGSSGNCYYLESNGTAILIDLGIGIRAFKRYMDNYGLTIPKIAAIIVTHDHTDHIKAVGPMAITYRVPVYASPLVHEGITRNRFMTKKIPEELKHYTTVHTPFEIGNFRITPFTVPHDSNDNNGYFIELIAPEEDKGALQGELFATPAAIPSKEDNILPTFCILTDVGRFTEEMIPFVARAKYLIIEANYDAEMLAHGPYPKYLQDRISSGCGHLENSLTAAALREHLTPLTERIWLCHLSADNNHPERAVATVREAVEALPFTPKPTVEAFRRTVPSELMTLR